MTALQFKTASKRLAGSTLTKKASLNAVAAMLDYGARLLIAFLLNPLMVTTLGDYFYGVWQISRRLAGYLSIGGGRPTQALKWTVAHQQSSTDYDKKRRDVGSAVAVWFFFLPFLAIIGAILVWFAPTLLRAPVEFVWTVRMVVALLVIDLLVTDLADVPQSVLRGENLGYQRMGLSTLLLFVGGGLTALALYLGSGLIGVAVVTFLMTLLTGLFYMQVVRRYVPWFGLIKPTMADVRQFFSLSWWFTAWRLVQQAMMASDIVLLGLLSSVELVTVYSLTKFAPDALTNLMVNVVGGVLPGLGGVIGARDLAKAARIRTLLMAGTWLVVTVAGTTTLLLSRPFLNLWVGPTYDAGPLPTLLIIVMTAQVTFIRNDANLINLTLDLPKKVQAGLLSITIALGLAALLIAFFDLGIVGLCVGFIVGRLLLTVGYPWSLSRFFGLSFADQLKATIRPIAVTGLLFSLALIFANRWVITSWLGLIFAVGVTVVVVSAIAFAAGLSRDQRIYLWHHLRRIVA